MAGKRSLEDSGRVLFKALGDIVDKGVEEIETAARSGKNQLELMQLKRRRQEALASIGARVLQLGSPILDEDSELKELALKVKELDEKIQGDEAPE